MSKEQVLVFPECFLSPYLRHFQGGVVTDRSVIEDLLDEVLNPLVCLYMDRDKAEKDPRYKQVIPYCLLTLTEPGEQTHFFTYQRTRKAGESRLRGQWSVGVGGHINPCDTETNGAESAFWSVYEAGLRRELLEEVSLSLGNDLSKEAPVVGLVYDSSAEVGQVHFGIVHCVQVGSHAKLSFPDPSMGDRLWMDSTLLRSHRQTFESWSQFVIDTMLENK